LLLASLLKEMTVFGVCSGMGTEDITKWWFVFLVSGVRCCYERPEVLWYMVVSGELMCSIASMEQRCLCIVGSKKEIIPSS